ncbi:neutral zinc metallopeptidase [Candidatus Nomurabacteria bacterium]|nr:neutral zinc metallopeptidase [Candidatus Nomurabacteria bacterium]
MAFWDKLGTSGNVEDRRGAGPLTGGIGIWATLGVMVLGLLGINADPRLVETLLALAGVGTNQVSTAPGDGKKDGYAEFASSIIGSTDQFWTSQLSGEGATYKKPRMVLFRGATQSGCGIANSETGPHYCPVDQTIYLDETFFEVLERQLGGSKGDVAQSYVMAHEVGHHVQNQLGALTSSRSNSDSVKTELQADCYAGLWARSVRDKGIFENENEINEALSAASAVGDDRIQEKTSGKVNPETWTHGSAKDRKDSFLKGYESTSFKTCLEV